MPPVITTVHKDQYDMKMAQLEAFKAAARKFIAKVDAGQARSVITYRELKAALEMGD